MGEMIGFLTEFKDQQDSGKSDFQEPKQISALNEHQIVQND